MDMRLLKPETKAAISETLRVLEMLSPDNAERVREEIESMKTEEEIIQYIIEPLPIYMDMYNEIPKLTLDKVIKSEGIIVTEKFTVPHLGVPGMITNKDHIAIPLPVRANQQKIFKEGKSAKESSQRNVANQVSGDNKSGVLSDTEIVTTNTHGGADILKELLGPTSHNLVASAELKAEIIRTGKASLKDISNDPKDKGALLYADQVLKCMGFDSDILEPPEK